MGDIADAAQSLKDVLDTVPDLRATLDPGAVLNPPAAVVGPPTLSWLAQCAEPSNAQFLVWVVTTMDERTMTRLWDLIPLVTAAIDRLPAAAVTQAQPSTWTAADKTYPAYEITVEVTL